MPTTAAKHRSLWLDTSEPTDHPLLEGREEADVAVLGAGIVGVTLALLLRRDGADVVLVDAERVGTGVTGHTTAKVSSLHGITYGPLVSTFGEEAARLYGAANEAAIDRMERFVEDEGIDCDWRRRDAYVYAEDDSDRAKVEAEAETAARLGLPASYVDTTPLPWPVAGAVRFGRQAEFHPHRYLRALAERFAAEGGRVFERTRALGVGAGDARRHRVELERGAALLADDVVLATHFPFLDRGLFFARMHPERSYALALRIEGEPPEGMFLSTESPAHTLRSHPFPDGEVVIAGGESHKAGQGGDMAARVRRVEAWARERLPVRSVEYRWSTQDNMPVDGAPYVGRLLPVRSNGLFVATGFKKWGLANGTAAAMLLADEILGRPNDWHAVFDSTRAKPLASAKELVKENANVGLRFVRDHATRRERFELSDLARGEGRVGRLDGEQVAAYRDDDGRVHAVSPVCTHLKCIVSWNGAERSWDCPCHGSRFDVDGSVLQGPAVRGLERRKIDPG